MPGVDMKGDVNQFDKLCLPEGMQAMLLSPLSWKRGSL